MKIKKRHITLGIVLVIVFGVCWLLYEVATFRSRPPSRKMIENQRINLVSGDESKIYEALRLLSIYQVSDDLRTELEFATQHESARVRSQAVFLIARYRDVRAGVLLTQLLDDSDPDVSEEAGRGLHIVNNTLGLPSDFSHFAP